MFSPLVPAGFSPEVSSAFHQRITARWQRMLTVKKWVRDTRIHHLSKPTKPQAVCSVETLTAATLSLNRTTPVTDPSNKAAGERGLSIPECSSNTPLTRFQHGRRVLNHSIKITGHIACLSLHQPLETRGHQWLGKPAPDCRCAMWKIFLGTLWNVFHVNKNWQPRSVEPKQLARQFKNRKQCNDWCWTI